MKVPQQVPEKGFYYHYKHDPNGPINTYAYELIGVGCHTEDDCRPEDANMAIYRPIYESSVYKVGKLFDIRPLDMWMGKIMKDGKNIPRFSKINDESIIEQLKKIGQEMYGG